MLKVIYQSTAPKEKFFNLLVDDMSALFPIIMGSYFVKLIKFETCVAGICICICYTCTQVFNPRPPAWELGMHTTTPLLVLVQEISPVSSQVSWQTNLVGGSIPISANPREVR